MKNEVSEMNMKLSGDRLRNLRKSRGYRSADDLVNGVWKKDKDGNPVEKLRDGITQLFPNKKTSPTTIRDYERGKHPISTEYAFILGEVLDCSPDYLLLKRDTINDKEAFFKNLFAYDEFRSNLTLGFKTFADLSDIQIETSETRIGDFLDTVPTYHLTHDGKTVKLSFDEMQRLEVAVFRLANTRLMELFDAQFEKQGRTPGLYVGTKKENE